MSRKPLLPVLKWTLAVLLVAILVGGAALIQYGPVRGYEVTCSRQQQVACLLERDTATGPMAWQVPMEADARARVEVRRYRRGSPRTFLYIDSGDRSVFAAEFEGATAHADAQAAAARLNRVFRSAVPASVRVEARPPSFMRPLVWAGFAFFGLLVAVILRELFRPDNTRPTPARPRVSA